MRTLEVMINRLSYLQIVYGVNKLNINTDVRSFNNYKSNSFMKSPRSNNLKLKNTSGINNRTQNAQNTVKNNDYVFQTIVPKKEDYHSFNKNHPQKAVSYNSIEHPNSI